MGMFAYIIPECELPEWPLEDNPASLSWQTKCLEPGMLDTYRIRPDGQLEHQDYDIEDRSDPNAPKGSLIGLEGCMTQVDKRWAEIGFTGSVNFYSDTEDWHWIEYVAFFDEGKLFLIKQVEATRESPNA